MSPQLFLKTVQDRLELSIATGFGEIEWLIRFIGRDTAILDEVHVQKNIKDTMSAIESASLSL